MTHFFRNLRTGLPAHAAVVLSVLVVGHTIVGIPTTFNRSTAPFLSIATELLFSAPSIGYLLGVSFLRFVVGAEAFLIGLMWLFMPIALHAIDKTLGFWTIWLGIGLALVFACLGSFAPSRPQKDKSKN